MEADMLRCIVIDDSSVIRTVAARIISNLGEVNVLEAPTGRSGYDICADNMPDIVIIDGDLPDMAGIELLEDLSGIDHRNEASLLLLLAEVDLSSVMRAKRAGAAGFLLKPFDRETLMEVVGPLIEAKRAQKEAARAA